MHNISRRASQVATPRPPRTRRFETRRKDAGGGRQGEAAVDQLRRWLGEKIGEIPAPQRASERAAEAVTVDYGTVNGAAQHWRCRRPPMFSPYVTSPSLPHLPPHASAAAAKLTRLYPFTREKRERGATDTESHICRSELAWAERKRVAFFALLVIRRSRNQIKSRLSKREGVVN